LLVTRLLLNVKKIGEGQGMTNTGRVVSTLMFARQNDQDLEDEDESGSIGRDWGTDVGVDDQNITGAKEKNGANV
jgi:hypothetical protein